MNDMPVGATTCICPAVEYDYTVAQRGNVINIHIRVGGYIISRFYDLWIVSFSSLPISSLNRILFYSVIELDVYSEVIRS